MITSLHADRPSLPVTDHFITPTVNAGVENAGVLAAVLLSFAF